MSKKNRTDKTPTEVKKHKKTRKTFQRKTKENSRAKVPTQLYFSKALMGVFIQTSETEGYVTGVARKTNYPDIALSGKEIASLRHLDVIIFQLRRGFELLEILGGIHNKDIYTKMSLWEYEIPAVFSKDVCDDARLSIQQPITLSPKRVDLRHMPFVTVDGEDAKDFDDAICATPAENGGWNVCVAIADVSYYVKPHSPLDREAQHRGNSVYFPNAVVPMLPFELSDDICSLKPHEDRLVLAIDAYVKPDGTVGRYRFMRGIIKSRARLTYTQVQNQIDTGIEPACASLVTEINDIYQVYQVLDKARQLRGTLEISIPEYKVVFNAKGAPVKMVTHCEHISNKIIEEFMILANVCAAHALLKHKYPSVFRNHDEPDPKRYHNMIRIIKSFGYKVPKNASLTPHTFNAILAGDHKADYQDFVQELILRCQAQANYETNNKGHFGLSLKYYTHFTSPIRRYSDLIVHRSLINALKLDNVSYTVPKGDDLEHIAQHISKTERVAMNAERTAKERFAFAILTKDIGKILTGRISGIVERGFFVQLQGTCAEGFIPLADLDDDYYTFDANNYRLIGRKKKNIYHIGQALQVKILTVNPMLSKVELKILA